MQKTGEICTICGGSIYRNESGVGQCKSCLKPYGPEFTDGRTERPDRLQTTRGAKTALETAKEGKGRYFGYKLRSVYDHEKAGRLPGTVSENGKTVLTHTLTGPQRVSLPRKVEKVKVSGSAMVAGMDLKRQRPYVELHPERPGTITVTIRFRRRR
ncbi:MAG: hypothetical protein HY673_09465 [Chloroflexi bacterium]|nr:hypothetical protein [Chloroflexota bacterium]